MSEKDPADPNRTSLFRIDLSKAPKMGLKDFVRQRKEARLVQREREKAEEQARLSLVNLLSMFMREREEAEERAGAVEAIPVKDHPLRKMPADLVDLYVKSVLILRSGAPSAFPDPGEETKQLRLFAKSLGISRERQGKLEDEVSHSGDQTKTATLLKLSSSRCGADGMTCLMCDAARLHGSRYKFRGEFADFWRDAACGIADLSDEQLAAAEKLCRDIASGRKLASPGKYAPIPEALVAYFGQEAFVPGSGGSDPA